MATRRWLGVRVGAMVVAVAVPTHGLMVIAAPDRLISLLLQGSCRLLIQTGSPKLAACCRFGRNRG
ncbi:hypothetical protein F3087_18925 [Nocardia colli]|uniref:Uncharacterized protein n=1 Tax=Nocardia colli TaxID=2545717 RepID=A0A5N0EK18_9NOCA|nr:hypothetical protein [Nocardia colli]KAA8887721.1 hypothetical protein F3087_18925 [Nocardia colli]